MELEELSVAEKAAMLSGGSEWDSRGNEKAGIPSFVMSDGPHGVRRQLGEGEHLGLGASKPATCFPTAGTVANSWDPALAEEMGEALGQEAHDLDVNVLLGPGMNIKRNPLCGRNFEYYSEDPIVAGRMAAGLIRGIQSNGVSACPKHFAVNSQELRRQASNSVVDERTMREIYLTAFEIAVREAAPMTIMTSYNEINGVYGQKLEKQVIETAYYDDEESDLSIIASCEVNADEDQLPEGLELRNDGMLIGTPKEVGTFNIYVDFTADNGQSNGQTVIVEIGKATYDMSGVSFEDATYPYDGKEKTLEISGELPEGVTVSYENNTLTNAGSVKATAEFTVADTEHYNEIDEVLYADLTIEKAIPEITISADKATLTGSGTVTLTVEKPEDGKVTVTCDKEGVTVTENEDGTFTATLPNADETYTFTAKVEYDENANYVNVDPVTCTVTVTYQSTSHGGGGSSRNNSYAVSTPKADNGSVTVNNGSTAKKGDTVTITVKPDAGYEIDKVTVTDSKGNQITVTDKGDGKFSFVMPDSKVDVKVTFVKSEVKPD